MTDPTATDWTDEEYILEVLITPCPDDKIEVATEMGYMICQVVEKNTDTMSWAMHVDDYNKWADHPVVKAYRFAKCGG